MIAAIYARKSTDQNVSDEAKSVARQVEHARAYASRRGWTVAGEHVYVDDGISGAEFLKRPGLTALLAAVRAHPCPVQALVTMEVSRLGREQTETAVVIRELLRAGVRVFTYADGCEITQDSALEKFQLSALNFVAEMERELARTREALRQKAGRGHVAGGKVYGYRNVDVTHASVDGRVVRDHVERQVVAAEAAVIRRIFEEIAAGRGFSRIAKGFNAEGIPCPATAAPGRPAASASSCSVTCTAAGSCGGRRGGSTAAGRRSSRTSRPQSGWCSSGRSCASCPRSYRTPPMPASTPRAPSTSGSRTASSSAGRPRPRECRTC